MDNKIIYHGIFENKEDLLQINGLTPEELEKCEILFAAYFTESYDGDAKVIFKKDGKMFASFMGHCSCNDLEWDPEETSIEELKFRHTKGESKSLLKLFFDQ